MVAHVLELSAAVERSGVSMFNDDELLPISALQHLLFCERQCALIHIERLWEENRFTAEGRHFHARAHDGMPETRGPLRTVRGLILSSRQLGLIGQSDIVEFLAPEGGAASLVLPSRVAVGGKADWRGWTILPVEYKRGRPKTNKSDCVQLCAQGLCLEEMLGVEISAGALFYGQRKRRTEVLFDKVLRTVTLDAVTRLRRLIADKKTPPAVRESKCDTCSLLDVCLPEIASRKGPVSHFVDQVFSAHLSDNSH